MKRAWLIIATAKTARFLWWSKPCITVGIAINPCQKEGSIVLVAESWCGVLGVFSSLRITEEIIELCVEDAEKHENY